MSKLSSLAALGAGYLLGTTSGRGRYEQIVRAWQQVKASSAAQEAAGVVQAQAVEVMRRRPRERSASRRRGIPARIIG